jgi:hypothetical protein
MPLVRKTEDHRAAPIKLDLGADELISFPVEGGVPELAVLGCRLIRVKVRDNLLK